MKILLEYLSDIIRKSSALSSPRWDQKAVELEVTEFLGRHHYQRHRDSLLRGYRNGYEGKQVQTAEGPLHLKMPQAISQEEEGLRAEWRLD